MFTDISVSTDLNNKFNIYSKDTSGEIGETNEYEHYVKVAESDVFHLLTAKDSANSASLVALYLEDF